jgi:hypothetical protein
MILLQPNGAPGNFNAEKGSESFVKGNDIAVLRERKGFAVTPEGWFPGPDFIDRERGLEFDIQKSPARAFPNYFPTGIFPPAIRADQ